MSKEQEFIERIQQHKGLINKLVFLYADHLEDRKDLRQEILLQAWKSYHNFRGDAKFSTWLYRVGINVGITFLDKRKKVNAIAEQTHTSPTTFTGSSNKELLEWVLKWFNKIDRTLILLLIEGYKAVEIAEMLGISQENARIKIYRIRQKLKEHGIEAHMV